MYPRALLGAVLIALVVPAPASAQVVADSLIGTRIRLHLAQEPRSVVGAVPRQALRGTLVAVTPDSLIMRLHPEAAPLSIAVSGIHSADVSRGVSRKRTAIKQGILGAATWAGLSHLRGGEIGGGETENLLIWAGGGFIVGAVFGSIFPEESWRRVFRR